MATRTVTAGPRRCHLNEDRGRSSEPYQPAKEVIVGLRPTEAFLGAIFVGGHGADQARREVAAEVEHARVAFLPPEIVLNPDGRSRGELLIVQPDLTGLVAPAVSAPWIRLAHYLYLSQARLDGGNDDWAVDLTEANIGGQHPRRAKRRFGEGVRLVL
jgi:hypothetical protein